MEDLIVLGLVQTVVRNMRNENEGALKAYLDCKLVLVNTKG